MTAPVTKRLRAIGLAALALGTSVCGGGRGGSGLYREALTIEPTSGQPGTTITWTMSVCARGDDISATLYLGTVEHYQTSGSNVVTVVEGVEGKSSTGTLVIPENAAPGPYTVAAHCAEPLPPVLPSDGRLTLGFKESDVQFEVTG